MFQADDPKTWGNLIVGFLLLSLGIIPFLHSFGFIGFTLPGFMGNIIGKIALWVIAAIGVWLIIDGFMEDDTIRMVTLLVAVVFLAVGVIQILHTFGVIGFQVPFLTLNVYYAIFAIEGLFLIIGAFATF